jgi:radical SAM superfamily enzyme YgiQ (UPF0313 family)
MKVSLISLDRELYCIGIRILSSCLRQAGHEVQCVFLPPSDARNRKTSKFRTTYSVSLLDEVRDLCADSGLVGLSLMTNQLIPAASVTEHLKKSGIESPIIWGGIQPTVEPEVCLEYADVVCLGEGEEALVELVSRLDSGRPYLDTRNMWFRSNGDTIRNPVRPLEQDLDRIPLPDYSCKNHFVAHGDHIENLTREKLVRFEGERFRAQGEAIRYPILTSRGCPFSCTYCCNSVYKSLYPGQKRLRWRSADNVISELQMVQRDVAPLSFVHVVDDNFTAQPQKQLAFFCERYSAEIGVPFACQVSPLTITAKQLETLLSAGCAKVTMGVETASERVAEIYDRGRFHKALSSAIALIESYRSQMPRPPTYQFIIDNPYETLEETLETLHLAVNLSRPWNNPIYSLMLFPGTPLYERAVRDGLIADKYSQIYGRDWLDQSRPYLQFWIRLYRANFPSFPLRILLWPWIARLFTSDFASSILRMRIFRWLWSKER